MHGSEVSAVALKYRMVAYLPLLTVTVASLPRLGQYSPQQPARFGTKQHFMVPNTCARIVDADTNCVAPAWINGFGLLVQRIMNVLSFVMVAYLSAHMYAKAAIKLQIDHATARS